MTKDMFTLRMWKPSRHLRTHGQGCSNWMIGRNPWLSLVAWDHPTYITLLTVEHHRKILYRGSGGTTLVDGTRPVLNADVLLPK